MKTAIEWLKEQYIERGETLPIGVFEEAKQKEKEQFLDFIEWIEIANIRYPFNNWKIIEQYYNQTYNQKQHIIDIMKADEDNGLYNQNES